VSAAELTARLSALAGTPDGDPAIDAHLRAIVDLVPAVVTPVDSASITVERGGRHVTLATSDELAARMDQVQYAEATGPCVQALAGDPVAVPGLEAATEWPRFREQARSLGLYASLSIPLFVGSGAVVASLNLYSRVPADMAGLITRVVALHHHDPPSHAHPPLGDGGEHLVAALTAALEVHAEIQHALGVLIGSRHLSAPDAYAVLCELAQGQGIGLQEAATDLLERREA
jgi:hypothetical protein